MREEKYLSEAAQFRAKYEPIIATVDAELQHDRDVLAAACADASRKLRPHLHDGSALSVDAVSAVALMAIWAKRLFSATDRLSVAAADIGDECTRRYNRRPGLSGDYMVVRLAAYKLAKESDSEARVLMETADAICVGAEAALTAAEAAGVVSRYREDPDALLNDAEALLSDDSKRD